MAFATALQQLFADRRPLHPTPHTHPPTHPQTSQEVETDLRRVFATGWFSSCVPDAEDTRDGVKLIIKVTPNPELRGIVARGGDTLPTRIVQVRGLGGGGGGGGAWVWSLRFGCG